MSCGLGLWRRARGLMVFVVVRQGGGGGGEAGSCFLFFFPSLHRRKGDLLLRASLAFD